MNVCFVGEQPGGPPGSRGGAFEGGQSAERLAGLMGVGLEKFKELYDRINLIEVAGVRYTKREAARTAEILLQKAYPAHVFILCGRRVAEAFNVVAAPFFEPITVRVPHVLVLIPHPSGRCRWWNRPENVELARRELARYRVSG